MAILSNINGKFAVDSTGAIELSGDAGAANEVLVSGGAGAAPTWVAASTVIGGPYLPLSGGILTGATSTSSGISFTVGGILTTQSSSSGDYVRLYGSSGTAQWDIYGNGENLRLSENSGGGGLLAVDSGATFGGDVQAPGLYVGSTNTSFDFYNNGTTYLNGTTTIDSTLTINGNTIFNPDGNNSFSIEDGGTNAMYMRAGAGDEIYFGANNTWQMRFQVSGNVTMDNGGNFGIGTASPNDILHVSDAGTATLVRIGNNGAYDAGVYFNTSTDWTIGTDTSNSNAFTIGNGSSVGASPKITITTGGNVGIGNTAPAKKLEISSPTSGDGILLTGDGTGGGMATGNYRSIGFSYTDTDTSYGSEMKFEIPDSANHGGQISFWTDEITGTGSSIRAMTISRSQNVGIGTGSPTKRFQVSGSIASNVTENVCRIEGGTWINSGGITIESTGANSASGRLTTIYSIDNQDQASPLAFGTGTTEAMRITTDGVIELMESSGAHGFLSTDGTNYEIDINRNPMTGAISDSSKGCARIAMRAEDGGAGSRIIFGTASANNTTATERMRINHMGWLMIRRTTSIGDYFLQVGDASIDNGYPIYCTVASTAGRTQINFSNYNNNSVGSISTSGSATAFNTSSDYRLKEDLKEFNGLDIVSQIKTYDFKWKDNDNYEDCDKRGYGVIAHEIETILPQIVKGEKDAVNKDRSISPQGVDYAKIVPLLVKSIQELEARVKELENK